MFQNGIFQSSINTNHLEFLQVSLKCLKYVKFCPRDLTKPRGGQNLKFFFRFHPSIWKISAMEAVQVVLYVKKYSMGKEGTPPAPLMPVAFKQLGGYPPFPQTTSSTVRLGLWWKSGESSQQCPPSFKPALSPYRRMTHRWVFQEDFFN